MRVIKGIYNEEQKMKYVDYEISNRDLLIRYFRRVAFFEKKMGKDISEMSKDEVKETLIGLKTKGKPNYEHIISFMKGYVLWVSINYMDGLYPDFLLVSAESLDITSNTKRKMVKDPEELEKILNLYIDKAYLQENRWAFEKLVCWLLYSGMTVSELSALEKTDIDNEGKIKSSLTGKEYIVSDQVIALWREVCEITFLEQDGNGRGKQKDRINRQLIDNNYLFRKIEDKTTSPTDKYREQRFRFIVSKVSKRYSETGDKKDLDPTCLRESGTFYRWLNLERNGEIITKEKIESEFIGSARRGKLDYQDWKIAFWNN